MRLVACISSGSNDGIVRALPLLVGWLASWTSIRNEFYRYRQISPFKPSDQSFREIYIQDLYRIYIYIYSLFLTKRPTFFRNQSRSRLNYRWPLRITLLLPSLLWNLKDRSKQGSKEAKEEGKRKDRVFPRSGNPRANRHGRSLEIFLHRGAQSRARDIARDAS